MDDESFSDPNLAHSEAIKIVKGVQFSKEDDDHVLKRAFKRLHLYNLYHKHSRLVQLDKKIAELEVGVVGGKPGEPVPDVRNIAVNIGQLLTQVDQALKDFDAASLQFQRSMNAPQVPSYFLQQLKRVTRTRSLSDYRSQYDKQDGWDECTFHLASEKGFIHRCVDRNDALKKVFVKDPEAQQSIMYSYSATAVRVFEEVLVHICFCLLLLIPIVALSYIKDKVGKLMIVFGFILLSAMVASLLANTTQKSSIAVIAGYAAILVVFLGNSQSN
ncbi:hypothetical protein NA57DRAFT_77600 [Rhizodiscina lignyota]|uniref:DUF6594 domain-containing protein n=1 Tax=Rhizodiscina lignyota TaxID=1504668 RepID=A0A9P4M911_9PEZI|nr:hypothetical protein NA57DRAFT_77600 [Rhizodiscina lignyota]